MSAAENLGFCARTFFIVYMYMYVGAKQIFNGSRISQDTSNVSCRKLRVLCKNFLDQQIGHISIWLVSICSPTYTKRQRSLYQPLQRTKVQTQRVLLCMRIMYMYMEHVL